MASILDIRRTRRAEDWYTGEGDDYSGVGVAWAVLGLVRLDTSACGTGGVVDGGDCGDDGIDESGCSGVVNNRTVIDRVRPDIRTDRAMAAVPGAEMVTTTAAETEAGTAVVVKAAWKAGAVEAAATAKMVAAAARTMVLVRM